MSQAQGKGERNRPPGPPPPAVAPRSHVAGGAPVPPAQAVGQAREEAFPGFPPAQWGSPGPAGDCRRCPAPPAAPLPLGIPSSTGRAHSDRLQENRMRPIPRRLPLFLRFPSATVGPPPEKHLSRG